MRTFVIAFALTLLLFVGLNLLAAHVRSDCGLAAFMGTAGCSDDIRRAGFPLQFWEEGGFAYRRVFSLPALLADLGLGLGAAVVAGWAACCSACRWWPRRRAPGGA